MCKLKSLNAALALALGLGFGIATAQTDQVAQQGNALDKPSNKADQQAVGIPAKPGTQSGQAAADELAYAADELAYMDSSRRGDDRVYGWRPSGEEQFAQVDSAMRAGDELYGEVYGWRPSEEQQVAQIDEDKTTGQGQGVRESGGQAGVQTPAQSGDSSVERLAGSDSAPDAGDQLSTRGGA